VRKEFYKEKKEAMVVREAQNEMWDKMCLKINCELGFKRSREAQPIYIYRGKQETTNQS
jgi:hypothetical protein